ncbi:MAG: VWA domain-containing protein [Hyphomicrobiales bacterium]|nr:VWA domain-containing protein [Hyphomicrobiales bacterium]
MRRQLHLASLLLATLILAPSPAHSAGPLRTLEQCKEILKGQLVDIHCMRMALWEQQKPASLEGLQKAKALAREQENATRGKVLERLNKAMAKSDLAPPVHSGTPPGIGDASGVLTDIDQTYKTKQEMEAAKKWFRQQGYTVQETVTITERVNGKLVSRVVQLEDAFVVDQLDYSGFTAKKPNYRAGSKEAKIFQLANSHFSEATATVGGQEWVQGVKASAKIDELGAEIQALNKKLGDSNLTAEARAAAEKSLKNATRRQGRYQRFLSNLKLTDEGGYMADMAKKASHHLDPRHWCPPSAGFKCWEEPRQAAKAAARILDNMPASQLSAEQQARLKWLKGISKGKEFLPVDPTQNAAANERLRNAIRQSFKEGFDFSRAKDNTYTSGLLDDVVAGRQAGNAESASNALRKLDKRRAAASRIRSTMEAIYREPGGAEMIHEWLTGQKLEKTVSRNGETIYKTVERFTRPDGTIGTRYGTLTPDQVQRSGRKLITRNAVLEHMLPGTKPIAGKSSAPSFASFAREPSFTDRNLKNIKSMGKLGWTMIGLTALASAHEATQKSAKDQVDGLSWTDIKNGNMTPDKVKGWAYTTAVGTAITIKHLTMATLVEDAANQSAAAQGGAPLLPGQLGVVEDTVKGTVHGVGLLVCNLTLVCPVGGAISGHVKGSYEEAVREEQELAQKEGREPNQLHTLKAFIDKVNGEEWARKRREAIADWAKAWVNVAKSEYSAYQASGELQQWLERGGLETLLGKMATLRQVTNLMKTLWDTGAQSVTDAVFLAEDLPAAQDRVRLLPTTQHVCGQIRDLMNNNPTATEILQATKIWGNYLTERKSAIYDQLQVATELYGAASTASATLGDGLMNPQVMGQQEELRQQMKTSLARLRGLLPEDAVLKNLDAETDAMKDPVPLGNAEESFKAAREYQAMADKAIEEMIALIKIDPTCDPAVAPPDDADPLPPQPDLTQDSTVSESIVILLDASSSMRSQGKMDQAKRSAVNVLRKLSADTEVALIVFYSCRSIVVEQHFTTDISLIEAVLPKIQPSGNTPLAAATMTAKKYMRDNAAGAATRLVVLTDGKETCQGDPIKAARS